MSPLPVSQEIDSLEAGSGCVVTHDGPLSGGVKVRADGVGSVRDGIKSGATGPWGSVSRDRDLIFLADGRRVEFCCQKVAFYEVRVSR